jgi:hypothetical protein
MQSLLIYGAFCPPLLLCGLLQLLHHGAFMVLLHAAARVIFSCVDHAVAVGQLLEATLAGINTPARWGQVEVQALDSECELCA